MQRPVCSAAVATFISKLRFQVAWKTQQVSHWGEGVLLLASLSTAAGPPCFIRILAGGEGRAGPDSCCLWSMSVLDCHGSAEGGGEHPEAAGDGGGGGVR